mmetsp:Transcript_90539/g.180714  ORF Transcript_90539/g.180714 Transcript_90539/m.180714 type:complete len:225 (-) Transcript_90539:572-1246(-)
MKRRQPSSRVECVVLSSQTSLGDLDPGRASVARLFFFVRIPSVSAGRNRGTTEAGSAAAHPSTTKEASLSAFGATSFSTSDSTFFALVASVGASICENSWRLTARMSADCWLVRWWPRSKPLVAALAVVGFSCDENMANKRPTTSPLQPARLPPNAAAPCTHLSTWSFLISGVSSNCRHSLRRRNISAAPPSLTPPSSVPSPLTPPSFAVLAKDPTGSQRSSVP